MTNNKKWIYKIKVPKKVIVLYNVKKNILTIIGPLKIKSLKLSFKLFIRNNFIKINSVFCLKVISKNIIKKIYESQGTLLALIKQTIVETLYDYYHKLKIVGVGYWVLNIDHFNNQLLFLKIGLSHSLYYRIPNELKFFCLKRTKLFIFGNSYNLVTNTAANLRLKKKPDPYKGKGLLYFDEKIVLKKGKKI